MQNKRASAYLSFEIETGAMLPGRGANRPRPVTIPAYVAMALVQSPVALPGLDGSYRK